MASNALFPEKLLAMLPAHIVGTEQEPGWREAILRLTEPPLSTKSYVRLHIARIRFVHDPTTTCTAIRVQTLRLSDKITKRVPSSRDTQLEETLIIGPIEVDATIALHALAYANTTAQATVGMAMVAMSALIGLGKAGGSLDIDVVDVGRNRVATIHLHAMTQRVMDFSLYEFTGIFRPDDIVSMQSIDAIYDSICAPTPSEILDVLRLAQGSPSYADATCTAIDLGNGLVLKRSERALAKEAVAMEFVRRNTSIPVPKVHKFFEHGGLGWILMDKIDGVTLETCSGVLTDKQWNEILAQLHSYVCELRRLPRPASRGVLGSWPSGPYLRPDFDPAPTRPWLFVEEFWSHWVHRARRRQYPEVPRPDVLAHPCNTVLSHGDLQAKNIMVQGARIVAILDWETFGFYPDVWEWLIIKIGTQVRNALRLLPQQDREKIAIYEAYVRSTLCAPD